MANKKGKELNIEIKLPKDVTAQLDEGILTLKGPKGENIRNFRHKTISINCKEDTITLKAPKFNQSNKKLIKSFNAHIKNMISGCLEFHKYKLKICSGHFPMNVAIANNELVVKNFLGEKVPRTLILKSGAEVKVEGDLIVVESVSKEIAGQISSDIEQLTRRTGYDGRIFQDGIWIIVKDDKEVG